MLVFLSIDTSFSDLIIVNTKKLLRSSPPSIFKISKMSKHNCGLLWRKLIEMTSQYGKRFCNVKALYAFRWLVLALQLRLLDNRLVISIIICLNNFARKAIIYCFIWHQRYSIKATIIQPIYFPWYEKINTAIYADYFLC